MSTIEPAPDPSAPASTFRSLAFVSSFGHLGTVRDEPASPLPLLLRTIPGSDRLDAMMAPPYAALTPADLDALERAHPDLVSVSGVTSPVLTPESEPCDPRSRPYKDHFAVDPTLPLPSPSARTRAHLHRGSRRWQVSDVADDAAWDAFADMFSSMIRRRGLTGTWTDHPRDHFDALRSLPGVHLVGVHDGCNWGASGLVIREPNEDHLLHVVTSDDGLRADASYVVMDHLVRSRHEAGRPLFIGGVPDADTGGMERFKRRWSNATAPVHLIALVPDPEGYRSLAGEHDPGGYFPAYRRPAR